MKKSLIFLLPICFITFIIFACGSTPKSERESVIEEPKNDVETFITEDEDVVELLNEEITMVETPQFIDEDDEEYLRSTNEISSTEKVTKDEFAEDKAKIVEIIEKLQDIMEREDAESWLKYISPDSIKYYSHPANIRKVQKKLPNKTIELRGIGDYFKYVFIPSRKRNAGKNEIRYISKTKIKAVKVKENGGVSVYYTFVKINGKWLVDIPPL